MFLPTEMTADAGETAVRKLWEDEKREPWWGILRMVADKAEGG